MANLIHALGLMSGTSLDGIDVALISGDGRENPARGPFLGVAYSPEQRARLRAGLEAAKAISARHERPGGLAALERDLTLWHAQAVKDFLGRFGQVRPGLIGFHGQTVLHRPEAGLTVQLGDGALLARETGIAVVADMRAADVAAGGQGAPLVPAYHAALAAGLAARPVAFVNIGGVANLTFVGRDGGLVAFDTGPGNALLDDWALAHTGRAVDADGALAASGRVDEARLAGWLSQEWFRRAPPKSLDRLGFAHCDCTGLSAADGAATFTAFTARAIAQAGAHLPEPPAQWIICGGGRRNPVLMAMLAAAVPGEVVSAEQAGFDGDAMEAEAWAHLAIRSRLGLPLSFPATTGVRTPVTGGVMCLP